MATAYLVSAALALLLLGRLSTHLGRRPIALVAVGLSATGTASMIIVHSAPPLTFGRLLQGVACGLASSALGAYVVDTAPERFTWLAPIVTSTGPMLGVPAGALVSGALVELAPAPRALGPTAI